MTKPNGAISAPAVSANHQNVMPKKTLPASQPIQKARFAGTPNHAQNSPAAPTGAKIAAFVFGNASAIAIAPSVATTNGISEETMLRRAAIVSFVLATALVAACGHQVTPEPPILNSNLTGKLLIRFRTSGPLNFTTYTYAIIIDSCGGGVPLPNTFATSFNNYSYGFLIGGRYGSIAQPQLFQYYVNPNSNGSLTYLSKPLDPDDDRVRARQQRPRHRVHADVRPRASQQSVPGEAALPESHAAPERRPERHADHHAPDGRHADASRTTPLPVATTTQVVGNPNPQPTTVAQSTWLFNFFSIDQSNRVVDSLGINGPTDTSWTGAPIDVNQLVAFPIFRPAGSYVASDPSAALTGGEIDNYP